MSEQEWRKMKDASGWAIVEHEPNRSRLIASGLYEQVADIILRDHELAERWREWLSSNQVAEGVIKAAEAERDQWKALAEEAARILDGNLPEGGWRARFDALKAESEHK